MKKKLLFCACVLLVAAVSHCFSAAAKPAIAGIPGLVIANFPKMDGSDSTEPLRYIVMCRLLGFDYTWQRRPFTQDPNADIKQVIPNFTCSESERWFLVDRVGNSNTHASFEKLIDGQVELILVARSISRDEKAVANEKGVTLIEKPIAKDALTFMVNNDNPVSDLTIEQIQKIYTGEITNWKEVGGNDSIIHPYVRNANSGSQEKFETMVMNGLEIMNLPVMYVGLTMTAPYDQIESDYNSIGFTPFYYYSVIVGNGSTKAIGVNGVPMTQENVKNGAYPFCTDVYAAVRSDIDQNSMAYKLFQWLTATDGQLVVQESGYVPIDDPSGISSPLATIGESATVAYTDLAGRPCARGQKGIVIETRLDNATHERSSRLILRR